MEDREQGNQHKRSSHKRKHCHNTDDDAKHRRKHSSSREERKGRRAAYLVSEFSNRSDDDDNHQNRESQDDKRRKVSEDSVGCDRSNRSVEQEESESLPDYEINWEHYRHALNQIFFTDADYIKRYLVCSSWSCKSIW